MVNTVCNLISDMYMHLYANKGCRFLKKNLITTLKKRNAKEFAHFS